VLYGEIWLPGAVGVDDPEALGADIASLGLDAPGTSIVRTDPDPSGTVRWSRPLPEGALSHGGSVGNEWELLGVDVAASHLALARVQGRIVILDLGTGATERDVRFKIPFAPGVLQDPPIQAGVIPAMASDGRIAATAYGMPRKMNQDPSMQSFLFGLPPLDCPL
jgi:hypothetical protein